MKTILIILASLSSLALAMPTVGDSVVYTKSNYEANSTEVTTNGISITNKLNNNFQIEVSLMKNGRGGSLTSEVPTTHFLTTKKIARILTDCTSDGGTLEQLTVAAGTFNTCALPNFPPSRSVITWYARVPFGIVKIKNSHSNGDTEITELKSFNFGH